MALRNLLLSFRALRRVWPTFSWDCPFRLLLLRLGLCEELDPVQCGRRLSRIWGSIRLLCQVIITTYGTVFSTVKYRYRYAVKSVKICNASIWMPQPFINFDKIDLQYKQCFGSALTLCGSGSSFENECGSGSWIHVKNKNFVNVKSDV
jgi:hypothetical protein